MSLRAWGSRILEWTLLAAGVFFTAVFAGDVLLRWASSSQALREFDAAQAEAASLPAVVPGAPDFRLWPRARAAPMAVIGIAKVNMRVPVYAGADSAVLYHGVGWIAGTAEPGERGNIGIAGHRDSFFRGLKNVSPGDTIELATAGKTDVYAVDQIEIVKPDDVSVLRPRAAPAITLVTCYPFNFTGDAPSRYILHASLQRRVAANSTNARREGK